MGAGARHYGHIRGTALDWLNKVEIRPALGLAQGREIAHHPVAHPVGDVAGIGLKLGGDARLGCADVSFDLDPGEVLAIVGESGSGKSTLLSPRGRGEDSGDLVVDGVSGGEAGARVRGWCRRSFFPPPAGRGDVPRLSLSANSHEETTA
jgi:hypothetical protein